VVVLEGVGHYPQLEVQDAVIDAYLTFRTAITRDGAPGA